MGAKEKCRWYDANNFLILSSSFCLSGCSIKTCSNRLLIQTDKKILDLTLIQLQKSI